jgi:subtilisin family serine protease
MNMDKQPYIVLRSLLPDGPTPPPGTRTRESSRSGRPEIRLRVETEELRSGEAQRLRQQRDVLSVAPPLPLRLVAPKEKITAGVKDDGPVAWGVRAVGADKCAWTAEKIAVAVLDTGIDRGHEAFLGVDIDDRDFTGTGGGDANGHGTHCAAIIFGQGNKAFRCGVAPSIGKALIAKVLDSDGAGTTNSLTQAIIWALQQGANIISMSLGIDFPEYVRLLVETGFPVELATSKALEAYRENLRFFDKLADLVTTAGPFGPGALLIAAAGNESNRDGSPSLEIGVAPPAVASGVVSVAALQQVEIGSELMKVAPFSNTGAQVAAPGVSILSAQAGGGYVRMSGTSMAAPHVAGVAALWAAKMLSEETRLDVRALANRVTGTTRRFPDWQSIDIGAGVVQAPVSL